MFWVTQNAMAALFQKIVPTSNENELTEDATIRKNRIVQMESSQEVERGVTFYNLEMIIVVGYHVHSHRGTQFRRWETLSPLKTTAPNHYNCIFQHTSSTMHFENPATLQMGEYPNRHLLTPFLIIELVSN